MKTWRIVITLSDVEAVRLYKLAEQNKRRARDQAAFMLGNQLRRAKLADIEPRDAERGPQLAGGSKS